MIRVFGPVFAAVFVMLSYGLHKVKIDAKQSYEELQSVKVAIAKEQQTLLVLSAEWSHLNQPAKLQKMSAKYLSLGDVRVTQIAAFEDIPYLGLDLFDKADPFTGVSLKNGPRPKPDMMIEINATGGVSRRD